MTACVSKASELARIIAESYAAAGLTTEVVFLRVNATTSGAVHPIYRERLEENKTFDRHPFQAVVDENPKANQIARLGPSEEVDLSVFLYGANGGFVPQLSDRIEYRTAIFEVVRIERLLPNGTSQVGFDVRAKRFG